jgi:ribonuclease HII
MNEVVGIDEAGRGPLAGPVSIGVVILTSECKKEFFKGIKDSKKLSKEERELWFEKACEAQLAGLLNFKVALVSEKIIDKHGIMEAVRRGMRQCLKGLEVPHHAHIFLDGALYAPKEFRHQKTIIKGDEKIAVISLASICAKVTRDKYMIKLSKKYPEYGFDVHKGYGTKMHRETIQKYGPSAVHRQAFLKKI